MVDSSIALRQLVPSDAAALHGLELLAFPEDPWTEAQLVEELTAASSYYLGAFEGEGGAAGERLVGAGGVKGVYDADVMTIGVLPGLRGRGIGRALLAALIEHCRTSGIERVFLEVRASNRAAMALYDRVGFEELGRIRAYYRRPTEDAVTMRLELTSP